ncbi:hypothetical protein ACQ4PT_069329 [Festuca glaucescens]
MASNVNPSKRPFQKNSSEHNGRAKWQKTKHASSQQPQLVIQPGVPLIRILCPTEKCGNVIGKGGGIIAKIRKEYGVKIRVDEAVPGCDERVIVITAVEKDKEASHEPGKENDGGPSVSADGKHEKEKDLSNKEEKDDSDNVHGKEEKDDPERDDSNEEKDDSSVAKDTKLESERVMPSPMNAILHVFDRIFITEIENGTGDASGQRTPVSFRLLVLDSQVGWLLGNRGSWIKQMSADSGSEIRVSKEKLPSCALLKDELCQITGDLESVRKGLNAVAQVLFTHTPRESDVLPVAHPSGSSSHAFNRSDGLSPGMQPNFHLPLQGPSHARGPFDIIDQRPNSAPFPIFPDQRSNVSPFPAFPDAMHGHASVPPEPLTFRLLCSSDKVGSIIGKGGNSIKTIQKDTGCEIKIVETVPKSEDHVIVISGPAHPGDGISPAQNAILHVQRKIMPPTSNSKEGPTISRLIVSPNQVGCVLGKGGSIIAEMRKLSKAHIIVLSKDKIPRGVQESDEVVQITGDSEAIQEALMQITARLRNNLFRGRMASMGPGMQPPFGLLDPQFGAFAGIHESTSPRIFPNAPQFHKDFMGRPLDEMSAPWTTKCMQDVGDPMSISGVPGMTHRGMGGFSGPVHSSRPNITGNIMVPRFLIPALCGQDGGCLNMIREFSGAKITIDEPLSDSMDTTVMIFGTPDQMHAARSLIQAFVLSEPPAP